MKRHTIPVVIALWTLAGCDGSLTPPVPAPSTTAQGAPAQATPTNALKPGYVVGRVTDAAGKPLAGAKIDFNGMTVYGGVSRIETSTDASGHYEVQVGTGPITLGHAYMPLIYDGRSYMLPLDPSDGVTSRDAFPGEKGKVEDFVLKISGQINPTLIYESNYYGGNILVNKIIGFGGQEHPAGTTVTLTLQPVGALVDGSQGQVVTRSITYPLSASDKDSVDTPLFKDIPIGKYTLTATTKSPDGQETPLRVSVKEGVDATAPAPAESQTFTFTPYSTGISAPLPVPAYSMSGTSAAWLTLSEGDAP